MRDKLLIALLSVCSTLLAVNLITLWNDPEPIVHGQGSADSGTGGYILATTIESSKPICFVFQTSTQSLGAYMASKGTGVTVLGVRKLTYDLQIPDLAAKGKYTVKQARKDAGRAAGVRKGD